MAVPEIQKAIGFAEGSAYTPQELEAYELYWDAVSTEKILLAGGKTDGKVEREAEGIKKVAKNLLAQNLPLEAIAQATSLSLEELKQLKG